MLLTLSSKVLKYCPVNNLGYFYVRLSFIPLGVYKIAKCYLKKTDKKIIKAFIFCFVFSLTKLQLSIS